MKQKVFWLDLAVCSLWLFVALANCSWWSLPTHFLMVVTVVMRIILSFTPLSWGETKLDSIDSFLGSVCLAVC